MSRWTTRRTSDELVNVHEREVPGSLGESRELLATLATPQDLVWPTDRWPRIWFGAAGPQVGARGGHGPVRYQVTRCSADRIEFAFTGDLSGAHGLALTSEGGLVRWTHTLRFDRPDRVTVHVMVPLHDALLEDLLDQVADHAADRSVPRRPLPWRIRLLRGLVRQVGSAQSLGKGRSNTPRSASV